jgi:hypothetical protein
LKALIKQQRNNIPESFNRPVVVLFIATNDIVRATSDNHLHSQYLSLVRLVSRLYRPPKLILIALPPYPRYQNSHVHMQRIVKLNKFIATLQNQAVCVLSLHFPVTGASEFFEKWYSYPRRPDKLHLNSRAFENLTQQLVTIVGTKINK